MSFTSILFGKDHPSKTYKVAILSLYAVCALGLYALFFAEFVPTDRWYSFAAYLSVGLGICISAALYWGRYRGFIKPTIEQSRLMTFVGLAFVPLFASAAFWLTFVYSIPDIVTSLVGEERSIDAMVTPHRKRRARRSYGCLYYLTGEVLENAILSRVCISSAPKDSLDNITPVTLKVKTTLFGKHIVSIEGI